VGLKPFQEGERTVEHTYLGVGGDHGGAAARHGHGAEDVTVAPGSGQFREAERGNGWRHSGRSGHDDAVACHAGDVRNVAVEEAAEPA